MVTLTLTVTVTLSQKHVFVFMQDYQLNGSSLYYDMSNGMKTWLDGDDNFAYLGEDVWYLTSCDTYISIIKEEWISSTEMFIREVRDAPTHSESKLNSILYVYVGHNVLLDRDHDKISSDDICYDNMLFGCYTINWEGVVNNTLINTTSLIAPEAYTVLPAIIGWVENKSEEDIRKDAAWGYSLYQRRMNYKKACKLFNIKNE